MGNFFRKLKSRAGKDSPAWQQSAYYYDLYHHLPLVRNDSGKFSFGIISLLTFLASVIILFVYGMANVLMDSGPIKNSDYWTGIIALPIFIVLFVLVFIAIVRSQIKHRKRWKSFENAWTNDEGTIIGKWWESTVQVDNLGGLDYFIAIQYDVNRKVKAQVSSGTFYKIKMDGKVKLRFVRFQREVCELISM